MVAGLKLMNVAVLVSSCDLFKATWRPFCHSFRKYWPDCPWPVKFITNTEPAPDFIPMVMGDDGGPYGWSKMTRAALQQIGAPVVLWIHDDNWLCAPVNTGILVGLSRLFEDRDVHLIRLSNCYMSTICGPYRPDRRLQVIRPGSCQRTSLQPSLWRRETFLELLVDNESPWVWEGMAPHRSCNVNGVFLCCREGFRPLRFLSHVDPDWDNEAVQRGKWTNAARLYARREGLSIDFSIHPNGNPA